ncbi:hypothetical protein [Mycobacterium sp.]|uniref:Rv0361 family membrane protein n=1 Tax=Mycobacterium sp. TaxID=1785 RepID=UPI0031D44776
MGGIVAVAAMVVAATVILAVGDSSTNADEAQIRSVIAQLSHTAGTDVTAARGLFCQKVQHIFDVIEKHHRNPGGPGTGISGSGKVSIDSITVDGDTATATVTQRGGRNPGTRVLRFVKEGGAWKLCT